MSNRTPRKLHRGHFAFMRALTQGLDERTSWDRYLRLEGEHTDLRTVRRTVAWIRDEFAAAARRESRPGVARLVLLEPSRIEAVPPQPTLEEFAATRGMEDFSETEQMEAYEAAYPALPQRTVRASRRARLVQRQLEALRWLEALVAKSPQPADDLSVWLHPSLALQLKRAGVMTLSGLVDHVNAHGARWWRHVRGVGRLKSLRIMEWLLSHQESLGLHVGAHALQPRSALTPAILAAVVPAATALRPFEKFVVPTALDGRAGAYRLPTSTCLLAADTDHEAIRIWLTSKPGATGGAREALSATQRAYRKEAERLLLWAVLERGKAVSSLTHEDALAFEGFLASPPAHWCGPRHCQRWSPSWRPLEAPLSPVALRQCVAVLRSLFVFLIRGGYVSCNPFARERVRDAAAPVAVPERASGGRSLTREQWADVDRLLGSYGANEAQRRLARALRWLYATGLRPAEVVAMRCEHLEQTQAVDARAQIMTPSWVVMVTGRGGRQRRVPVPAALVDELGEALVRAGFEREPGAPSNKGIAVLARFDKCGKPPAAWSASGLYKAVRRFFDAVATRPGVTDAHLMRTASAHWFRHTYGVHALQAQAGQAAIPIREVQDRLGHTRASTTAIYLARSASAQIGVQPASKG